MAVPMTDPYVYFTDNNGLPLSGGMIFTYAAGTTTPQATYTDAGGLTANTNPVILDSAGRASIWLVGTYKIIVKDSAGVTIRTTDNFPSFATTSGGTYTNATLAGTTTLPGPGHYIDVNGNIFGQDITATGALYSTASGIIARVIGSAGAGYFGTTSAHPVIIQSNNIPAITFDINQIGSFASYFSWIGKKRATADFTKTSDTTLANVPNLTVSVVAGSTYDIKAAIYCVSGTSGGVKFAIGGTATATTFYASSLTAQTTSLTQANTNTLGAAFGGVTAVTAPFTIIAGTITVATSGTLTVQFAQNASNATPSTLLSFSTFEVNLVT